MRHFAQVFVLLVGFAVALLVAKTESSDTTVSNCFEAPAAAVPTICE